MADLPPPPGTLRLRLDREALASNWRIMDRLSGSAAAAAAVKANAYGLGAAQVAPLLREAGVRDFYVAHWAEAAALLDLLPAAEIGVLHGPLTAADAAFAIAAGVRPVINSVYQAQVWAAAGGGTCDLMVDTGINRLGVPVSDLGDPAIRALGVYTLMSHFASADEESDQNERQRALFAQVAAEIPARRRSLANSAGIALGPRYAFDLTRSGLALYGGVPRRELAGSIRQVAHPQVAVLQTRQLSAGDSVGYNSRFTARAAMKVATVSLGYADGFLRAWSGAGALRFGDAALPLLGWVSMDLAVVDCDAAPALREGDWLDVPYDLPKASAATGLSQYELLTVLGERFLRVL